MMPFSRMHAFSELWPELLAIKWAYIHARRQSRVSFCCYTRENYETENIKIECERSKNRAFENRSTLYGKIGFSLAKRRQDCVYDDAASRKKENGENWNKSRTKNWLFVSVVVPCFCFWLPSCFRAWSELASFFGSAFAWIRGLVSDRKTCT